MFRTIVVEDDPFHMEVLCDLIASDFPEIELMGKCTMSSDGVKTIREKQPDLVLLDIDLPDISGFEMLEHLQDMNFDVIFITSFEKFALEAHQYGASGFLVKPISRDTFKSALKKLSEKTKQKSFGNQLQLTINKLKRTIDLPTKIAVPSLKEINFLEVNQIVRLEAEGNYSTIFLVSGKPITSSKQIGEYESKLDGFGFFRIHDKHLINLRYVKQFLKGESGEVVMDDNTKLPVARRRKDEFLNQLEQGFL